MSILFAGTNTSRLKTNNTLQLAAIDATLQFTLCAWVKQAAFGSNQYVFSGINAGSGPFAFGTTTGGKITAKLENISSFPSTTFAINTWTHIACTYNGNTDQRIHIYQNGVEVAYASQIAGVYPGPIYPANGSLWLGGINGLGNNFNGSVAEACLFNRALTAPEILAISNSTTGLDPSFTSWLNLIFYYHLNGQTATEVDSTGNGANVGIPTNTSYAADSPGYSFTAGEPVNTLVSGGTSVPTTKDSGVTFTNPA